MNKTVFVTGGSRGIGKETCLLYANEGYRVIFTYHSDETSALDLITKLKGKDHICFQLDLRRPKDISSLFYKKIKGQYNIDVLVNNAGIFIPCHLDSMSYNEWQKVWNDTLNTNLTGLANLTFLISQQMIARKKGTIINVSSRGAFRGEPEALAYGASKGGLNSFSQSLARYLGKYNIGVIAVAPGFVETEMAQELLNSHQGEYIKSESPFHRVASPEEVAQLIVTLSDVKHKFLSGGIIDINGASFLRM